MKVLYITKHNPWGRGGGSTASRMYFSAFRKSFANIPIDFCYADSISLDFIPKDVSSDNTINLIPVSERGITSKLISPITHNLHRFQTVALLLLKSNQYTHCVFDHSSIAGSIINHVPNNIKTFTIHHNYEPDYFADNTPHAIVRNLLLPSVKWCERNAYLKSNVNIFLTEEDKNTFINKYGPCNGKNIITGLFEDSSSIQIQPVPTLNIPTNTIVITGSLNNVQNIDGIRYFMSELLPHIPKDIKIIISGQKPTDDIFNLVKNNSQIELIPNPDSMDEVIEKGNIFLSPARLGGGIKVRVTDGLKKGLPVIAHSVSARGYQPYIEKGYFKVFNDSHEFHELLLSTIEDIKSEKYTSFEIANFYKKHSSIDRAIESISILI